MTCLRCIRIRMDRLTLTGTQLLAACTRQACILVHLIALASSCTTTTSTTTTTTSSIIVCAAGTSCRRRLRVLLEGEMATRLLAAARRLGGLWRIESEVFPLPCGRRRSAGLPTGQQGRCGRGFSGQYGQTGLLALKVDGEEGRERADNRERSLTNLGTILQIHIGPPRIPRAAGQLHLIAAGLVLRINLYGRQQRLLQRAEQRLTGTRIVACKKEKTKAKLISQSIRMDYQSIGQSINAAIITH